MRIKNCFKTVFYYYVFYNSLFSDKVMGRKKHWVWGFFTEKHVDELMLMVEVLGPIKRQQTVSKETIAI